MSDKVYSSTQLPSDKEDACQMLEALYLKDEEEKLDPSVYSILRRYVDLTYRHLLGEMPIVDDVILTLENSLGEDVVVCKRLAESLKRNTTHSMSGQYESAENQKWLKKHSKKYAGQWVALDGNTLIANSFNAKEVFKKAEASGVKEPLILELGVLGESLFVG